MFTAASQSPLDDLTARRARIDTWRPISDLDVRGMRDEMTLGAWLDISQFEHSLVKPGDYLFDYHEAQTKLYLRCQSFDGYKELLRRYGLPWPLPQGLDHRDALFNVAMAEGVELDGVQRGFVYNIGGKHLIYCSIPRHALINTARRYTAIEKAEILIHDQEEAKEFLTMLAEKYFYHETGHFVYMHLLHTSHRLLWEKTVLANPALVRRVEEIQHDKHPRGAIPVANEAFADTFSLLVCGDRFSNRLGSFPQTEQLAGTLLEKIGCRVG